MAVLLWGGAGSFPASLKAVSEWFPRKERAQATGIFNAGAAMGPIITPLVVPAIALARGLYQHWGRDLGVADRMVGPACPDAKA